MEQRTFDEILDMTAGMLSNIMIPAGLMEQIAKPINYAVENIRAVANGMREQAKKEAESEAEPEAAQEPDVVFD